MVSDGLEVMVDCDFVTYEMLDLNGRVLSKGTFSYEYVIPCAINGAFIIKINTAKGAGVKKIAIQN
jgi:hypothetical protein